MRQVVREFQRKADEADFVAVIDDTGAHTARELLGEATGLAGALADGRAGGTCGTVMVQADNSWRTVVATLAVGMSGGVLAVVNRHTTPAEFTAAREDISPDAVIAEDSAMEEWAVPEALPGPTSTVLKGWSCRTAPGKRDVSRWSGGVLIGLTSGSTGRPKGVVQSEEALRYACTSTIAVNGLARGDAIAAIVPLSSTAAYCFGVYLSLLLGGPLLLTGKWDRAVALRRMAENDARWTMCVPTMALQMGAEAMRLRDPRRSAGDHRRRRAHGPRRPGTGRTVPRHEDPPSLRHVRVPRAHLPEPRRPRGNPARQGRAALPRYGRPRAHPGRAARRNGHDRPGTGARPLSLPGLRPRRRSPSPALTDDGYFATGDLLMTHEDGTLSIMGREKDVIIRGGRNIDITEIERAVAGHPRVARACVAAVPDEVLGERVALLVVTEDGGGIELDEVTGHLESAGLAKTKWPEYVWGVSELPQTRVGKLDRAGARDLAFRMRARTAGPAA